MNFSKSFSFFRGVKSSANRFSYRSRFYNREKEEFEKRKQYIEGEVRRDDQRKKEGRSISFRDSVDTDVLRKSYRKQATSSNVMILVISVILIMLCFLAFSYLKHLGNINV